MKRMRLSALVALLITAAAAADAAAELVRLDIARREVVLGGKPFGAAGPYEKIVGTALFELDPDLPQNRGIVDLALAPRNIRGRVEVRADFYLLKPVDRSEERRVGKEGRCRWSPYHEIKTITI